MVADVASEVVAFAEEIVLCAEDTVAFAEVAVACAVDVVAFVAFTAALLPAAAEALRALLTPGLTLAAEVRRVVLATPSRSCAKEWLDIAKEAMMIEQIAMRFIISCFNC
jgi:hypothetical protein